MTTEDQVSAHPLVLFTHLRPIEIPLGGKRLLLVLGLVLVLSLLLAPATSGTSAIAHAEEQSSLTSPAPHLIIPSSSPQTGVLQQGGAEQADTMKELLAIGQLILDILQGKQPSGAELLFQESQQSAQNLLANSGTTDLFFLDFGDPDLRINQFASTLAVNLLALTPLYVIAYLGMLVYSIWRGRPIPNPILYAGLVFGVMVFLAAFGAITQGLSELGRALASSVGGAGDAIFARATLLATITRVLANLQKEGGILSILALLAAIVEAIIILIQLAYRGLSMAIWRLLGVLLIPLSVLAEGANAKTAGHVMSGFFEAWLDMVGKITLVLIVLSLAASDSFAGAVWLILPAGLLVVALSWKFLGVLFTMIRDAVARAWGDMLPARVTDTGASLPAAAEAARSREVDEERRRLVEEK
jgi:hypothetical protein